ncbi:hypothetical protein GCM10010451_25740 [Streptomyces virens]|uniref:Uncharacterized protein n=1 Tax=Streptomyces virens TaxID=285572 RepID=A0ABP6PDL9_9ACTN|nr:hypothetical protein GCM10010247_11500 [Streptomyces calvus]
MRVPEGAGSGGAGEWGCSGTAVRGAEAVPVVAKGHSRSARGQPVRSTGGGRRSRGPSPRRVPDSNGLSPHADGPREKLPPPEGTGDSCYRPTGPRRPHQSLREEELEVNFRTT